MVLPQTLPIPTEAAIASFAFTDIAEGTGSVIYYAWVSGAQAENNDPLTGFHLTQTQLVTSANTFDFTRRTTAGTTELNFDTSTFNLPRFCSGTAYFSCSIADAPGDTQAELKVQLFKVTSADVEVALSSEIRSETFNGVALYQAGMIALELPITSNLIKKGEKIRLSVKLITTDVGTAEVNHDPQNVLTGVPLAEADVSRTKVMFVTVPFRIDL